MLLDGIALGDENQPVTVCEISQRLSHAWQQLNLMVRNRLREAYDPVVLLRSNGRIGQLLEAVD